MKLTPMCKAGGGNYIHITRGFMIFTLLLLLLGRLKQGGETGENTVHGRKRETLTKL
jgi:hypothetical protein